jgi:hypothetical protein
MMSAAVMVRPYADRRVTSSGFTKSVVYASYGLRQPGAVLDTQTLLARLADKKIRNADIARALGLPDSRIPEIKDGRRALKLDEAAKLVRAFQLEEDAPPLPTPIIRLVVRYIADELGARPQEQRLEDLSEDVRAFAAFVANPKVRRSIEAAEGFFEALRLRKPTDRGVRSETDPDHAH